MLDMVMQKLCGADGGDFAGRLVIALRKEVEEDFRPLDAQFKGLLTDHDYNENYLVRISMTESVYAEGGYKYGFADGVKFVIDSILHPAP